MVFDLPPDSVIGWAPVGQKPADWHEESMAFGSIQTDGSAIRQHVADTA